MSNLKVLEFNAKWFGKIPPAKVLADMGTAADNFSEVLVIARNQEGGIEFLASDADAPFLVFLVEQWKHALFEGKFGDLPGAS